MARLHLSSQDDARARRLFDRHYYHYLGSRRAHAAKYLLAAKRCKFLADEYFHD